MAAAGEILFWRFVPASFLSGCGHEGASPPCEPHRLVLSFHQRTECGSPTRLDDELSGSSSRFRKQKDREKTHTRIIRLGDVKTWRDPFCAEQAEVK